ncbi:MAG TPA: hypothetical protein VIT43_03365 [Candidatus Dormibacteraeota bacterium]
MRKLLVVPVTMVTVALATAFLVPALATGAVNTISPGVRAGVTLFAPGLLSGAAGLIKGGSDRSNSIPAPASGVFGPAKANLQGAGPSDLAGTSNISDRPTQRGHGVATAGRMNCGRFGNGFHGGKHDFVCPNRPFPAPVSNPT